MLRNRIRCLLALALCAVLMLLTAVASAEIWYCPRCGRQNDDNFCPRDGVARPILDEPAVSTACPIFQEEIKYEPVLGLTTMKIATRSGPSTGYTEQGTYQVKDQYLPIYSFVYDDGGVAWVQCEVTYGGALRRVYTGLKRFDTSTFDLEAVPEEAGVLGSGRVSVSSTLRYGPGARYASMDVTVSSRAAVTVITEESDWYQIEYQLNDRKVRGWIPVQNIDYLW